jgi:AraC-like DNA-binding protein
MNYRQITPGPAVAPYVEYYWTLEDPTPTGYTQRIVPDGRAVIILNFANPFESCTEGSWWLQPRCFLIGQITGPLLLRPSGPTNILGIQFRPQGASQLLGLPMSELTDIAVTLDDLSQRLFWRLEWLRDLTSPVRAVAALDSALKAIAEENGDGDDPISYAVRIIERPHGLVEIEHVARRVGWSARQLQRRFKDSVGISPKLFGRMQRFQGVIRAMENPALNWVNAAVCCGYYDQAHLIRDFREFTGTTPSALLDREIDLSRRFIQPECDVAFFQD